VCLRGEWAGDDASDIEADIDARDATLAGVPQRDTMNVSSMSWCVGRKRQKIEEEIEEEIEEKNERRYRLWWRRLFGNIRVIS
jgi:hypothetical protein